MGMFEKIFGTYSDREIKRIIPIAKKIMDYDEQYSSLSDAALRAKTDEFKARLSKGETLDDILPEAFAAVREASWRVLGMKHFYVQILGGIILHQGRISEMKTGEGKTLVSTLPAYLNALTGKGVHIVTVNDYLAKRDSEWMGKVFKFMGLSVGLIIHDLDSEQRRAAYNADITYATNNELGFDYLRDNMVTYKEELVGRGQNYAIIDEVDSILIDEARTPLIISGASGKSTELYTLANTFAIKLRVKYVKQSDDKELDEQIDADYIVDEKAKTATLTPKGIKKAEEFFNIENLSDPNNMLISHHINQAIKAHGVMKRDREYVVKNGEVIIVDEFTGRMMMGRRYSDGLHQAIEAKEHVKVERESKTLATITFQNFFRLYTKLSGMTGTALTEEQEFQQIYNLDVVVIPTNKDMIRKDFDDAVYKNTIGKYNAIVEQVIACHKKGQPVLVGTVSIEKSELISAMLKKRGIKHEVLNAKYHEKEAEIIAQAGKKGAVTIATNMAGRGTDIMLGGNAEHMATHEMRRLGFSEELIVESTSYSETTDEEILNARRTFKELNLKYKEQIRPEAEEVAEAGGLFVIGTERHESRRVDNQLRGRSGRQGDPGASKFFLSLEDDLMRLFGSERISMMIDRVGIEDDQPIEARLLSGAIENAQKKVEGHNFDIRKHVLQFDEVMNEQRKMIYSQRRKVLDGEDLHSTILHMMDEVIDSTVDNYTAASAPDDWDFEGLGAFATSMFFAPEDTFKLSFDELNSITREDITEKLHALADARMEYQKEIFGDNMAELERVVLLRVVDTKWMDHIDDMDQLKNGIGLNAYAQRDPVVEYRLVGSDMYDEMLANISHDTVRYVLGAAPASDALERKQVANPTSASHGGDNSIKKQPIVKAEKVGRNDPCPCGSGKKYKKCCGLNEE
ncbi:MAG: preprotein translocase subunit SecA [Ruminococcaceae bacterium]|nr:preprotein translocase subunit SecA [Oscillospiraceae bacterium]